MSKIVTILNEKIVPAIVNFTQARYMKALMDAFMGMCALSIAGSIFTLIKSLPLGGWYTDFLTNTGLMSLLEFPIKVTTDLMAVYLVFCIGYFVTKSYDENPLSGGLMALGSFWLLAPFEQAVTLTEGTTEVSGVVTNVLPISNMGAQGIFLAILVGMISSSIYVFLLKKNIKIKMPAQVPASVANMFESMIPTGVVFIFFMAVRQLVTLTPYGTTQNLIFSLLQAPLTHVGGGLQGMLVFTFMCSFLWLFGVHGSIVAIVGMYPIYSAMQTADMSAFAAGVAAPHPEWVMMPWTAIGGTGSTFALVLLMFFCAKSKQLKTMSRIALPTSLFNINEPLLFGIPIVMNPFLAVPFALVPVINLILTYLVMVVFPIIPTVTGAIVNGFMPVGVFGALTTSHWTGFLWTVVLIAIDLVLWFPFFKKFDKQKISEEESNEAAAAVN